jgi:predicted nuclease of restriction endonuclease-like RecB superfamily
MAAPATPFRHASERAFARLLDECGLRWEYEPHTFVLHRAADGSPAAAFVQDFYLPDLDVYIECTVMNPRYVTRKRWKVREATRRYGIVVTTRERADFERLRRAYGTGARADVTRATIGSAKASPSA